MVRYGAVGFVGRGLDGVLANNMFKISIDNNIVNPSYLFRVLGSVKVQKQLLNASQSTSMAALNFKTVSKVKIPLPPLETQKKIAAILDAADGYRQNTKSLIEKYDQLAQSLFLDMFGDPVTNPMGWEIVSLANCGVFKNGLNFSKSESGNEIVCLGVGDFKKLYKISNMNSLSVLNLSKLPQKDYLLQDGDLVFVRSNGNKALVGRCVVVYPNDCTATFSGFCIRYRIKNDFDPIYLSQLFRIPTFRVLMLKNGRGANIQNINQKLLSELGTPMPPSHLQQRFADRFHLIEQQKQQAQASLQKAEDLFNSLLQRAFLPTGRQGKGELVKE